MATAAPLTKVELRNCRVVSAVGVVRSSCAAARAKAVVGTVVAANFRQAGFIRALVLSRLAPRHRAFSRAGLTAKPGCIPWFDLRGYRLGIGYRDTGPAA